MAEHVAVVTGASGNIGRGVCRALATSGATVIAVDVEAPPDEGSARALVCDLTDPDACASAIDEVVRDFGGIDTLVNMAQARRNVFLVDQTDDDMRLAFETGPLATFRMMQLSYPHLTARGGGSIVNFGSMAGTEGLPGFASYAAAKEAIRGLTKVAAREWGRDNIRVNVVCPIAAPTAARYEGVMPAGGSTVRVPLRREGDPEHDIGATVVFLAGPGGSYITGRTIHVDGGVGSWR